MKDKLFNNLTLLALFCSAHGFFGMLYEGIVYGPQMLDYSTNRLLFWREFYAVISPIRFYIPLYPLSVVLTVFLFFRTAVQKSTLKRRLMLAGIFQAASFLCTIYILTQLHLKVYFGSPEQYANEIPEKTIIFNILSVFRIALSGVALFFILKAYVFTQQELRVAEAND